MCVCLTSLFSYLVQLRVKQEILANSALHGQDIKRHFCLKCLVRKLEYYLLTTDRSVILSHVHSPYTLPLHVRAPHCGQGALLARMYYTYANKINTHVYFGVS